MYERIHMKLLLPWKRFCLGSNECPIVYLAIGEWIASEIPSPSPPCTNGSIHSIRPFGLFFSSHEKKMEWIGIRSKRDRKEGKNSLGIWDALRRQRGGIGHCPRQMKRKTERRSMIWSFEGFELVSQYGGGPSFQNSCFIMPTRSVSHSTRDLFHGKQDKKSAKSFAISGKNRPVSKSDKSSEKKFSPPWIWKLR